MSCVTPFPRLNAIWRIVFGKPYNKSRAKNYVMCSLGRFTACYGILGEWARDAKGKGKRGFSKKVVLFPVFLDIENEGRMKLVGKEDPVLFQETVQTGPTQAGYPADLWNVLPGE